MDAIRSVVGSVVSQHLVPFDSCQSGTSDVTRLAIERLGLRYEGLLTTPSQITSGIDLQSASFFSASPSLKLMLFINNRMVECSAIKRSLESSYSTVLSRTLSDTSQPSPGGRRLSGSKATGYRSSLFVYLNLQLPAENLDVNVHPTKSEVHFCMSETFYLLQYGGFFFTSDQIISGLQDAVEHCLLSSAQLRSFLVRPLVLPELDRNHTTYDNSADKTEPAVSKLPRPQDKVRVDVKEQRLERFMIDRYQHQQTVNSIEGCRSSQPSGLSSCGNMNESLPTTFSSESLNLDGDDLQKPLQSTRESDTAASFASETVPISKRLFTNLRTQAGWSRMDAIRSVVGSVVSQHLVPFDSCQSGTSDVTRLAIERLGLRYEGLLTTPSQITSGIDLQSASFFSASPSLKLMLFINNRMVECSAIKRSLESSYSTVLSRTLSDTSQPSPGGRRLSGSKATGYRSSLFVYLNLQLPAENLDVNVHPTKSEVHFLHEIILSEPAPIIDLLKLNNLSTTSSKLNSDEAIRDAATTLLSHATMLWDYFSLRIEPLRSSGDPALFTLPLLLKGYIPDFNLLPIYVTRLATEVDWTDEMVCFEAVCRITSEFYAPSSPSCTKSTDDDGDSSDDGKLPTLSTQTNQVSVKPSAVRWRWITEHVLWPALSSSLMPRRGLLYSNPPLSQLSRPGGLSSHSISSSAFFRLTNLSDLYKVFERC
ncbi:hypothetical protein AHF37_03282 [Paragonimus kellicotti]|nr:hypothetical protein AHF37_03282 [Paragonimus kellicotti]